MSNDFSTEIQVAAAKVSPPILVAGASVSGWGPADWMYALTAVYVVLQGAYLLWKWRREWKAKRDG